MYRCDDRNTCSLQVHSSYSQGEPHIELYVSLPEYHAVLVAISNDWNRAIYLADWFEEKGMERHADYFRAAWPETRDRFYPSRPIPLYDARREWFQRWLYMAIMNGHSGVFWGSKYLPIEYDSLPQFHPFIARLAAYKIDTEGLT